jgi:hypothetical protein
MDILDSSLDTNFTDKKKFLDFILLCFFAFCQYVIVFSLFFDDWDDGYNSCGDGLLEMWNSFEFYFEVALFFLVVEVSILFFVSRLRTRIFKVFSWLILSFLFYPIFYLGNEVFSYSEYYEEFNSTIWHSFNEKPISMIRTFCADQRYKGITVETLENDLGVPDNEFIFNENQISYRTDDNDSVLLFEIEDRRISSYGLGCLKDF